MSKILLPASLLLALTACVADVGEGRVAATVQEAPPAEAAKEAAATPADATTLAIDVAQSKLHALGAKITATHPVVFHTWEGQVVVSEGAVVGLSFSTDVASLEADHPKLTAHLKDVDFFDVATYPKASFTSSSVQAGAEGGTHTVTGDLTIRGVTKRVSFPATIAAKDGGFEANTEFVINRQDFGVAYPGRPDDLVQDNVVLTVSWVAPAKG